MIPIYLHSTKEKYGSEETVECSGIKERIKEFKFNLGEKKN
jgi:hypothetical protein